MRTDDAGAYRAAGVDLDAADRFKERLKALVGGARRPEVLGGIGGFGGCFAVGSLPEADPVLVASADGVGTKVLVAKAAGRHDTLGADLVHHSIGDLLAQGARPLFFLDYVAFGRLDEDVALALVGGLAKACAASGLALLGGETAEMPDVYAPGDYDLAGFAVGVAPRARLERWNARAEAGDLVLGLPSSGLHTNGYSLARRILEATGTALGDPVPWGGETWSDALLAVHRNYLDAVGPLLDDPALRGAAHVTGGGFAGNLPRALPAGLGARLRRAAWTPPPVFGALAAMGGVDDAEMLRVFNMGIGFCLVVDPAEAARIADGCAERGAAPVLLGNIAPGSGVEWA